MPHRNRVLTNARTAGFILTLLLVIIFSPVIEVLAQSSSPTGTGPYFIYPPGTDWHIGGLGYHTSCNDENNPECAWLKSWDYIAPDKTPMHLPFNGGSIVMSCQKFASEYWSGFLTRDERIIVVRSDDGRWEIGSLHVSIDNGCLPEGAHVDAMGIWGYVGSEGNSGTFHNHLFIRDLQRNTNVADHDWFWNGGALGLLSTNQPNIEKSQTGEYPSTTYTTSTTSQPIASSTLSFPVSRSSSAYTENLEMMFLSLGKGVNQWTIPANGQWQSYNSQMGCLGSNCGPGDGRIYHTIAIKNKNTGVVSNIPGAGACDVASYVMQMASACGLDVDKDETHAYSIPGISNSYFWVNIWQPRADMRIKNSLGQDAIIGWELSGGSVNMWCQVGGQMRTLQNPTAAYQQAVAPPPLDHEPTQPNFYGEFVPTGGYSHTATAPNWNDDFWVGDVAIAMESSGSVYQAPIDAVNPAFSSNAEVKKKIIIATAILIIGSLVVIAIQSHHSDED